MKRQDDYEEVNTRSPQTSPSPAMGLNHINVQIMQNGQNGQNKDGVINNLQIHANGYTQSVLITCPYCKKPVNTLPEEETGIGIIISCFLLSFVSCCCIPFCMKKCKDKAHKCPTCMHKVGYYNYKPCC